MKKRVLLLGIVFLVGCFNVKSQEVVGKWKTIDDDTGEAKSVVEIYEENGKIVGKIIEILNPDSQDKLCSNCEGSEYNTPIKGLKIIKNLSKEGKEYEGGTIFDPEKGKKYKCKIWVDEEDVNTLNVRGYIAFFFRTQSWYRIQ